MQPIAEWLEKLGPGQNAQRFAEHGVDASVLARRDLVWINVTSHPTAAWLTHQITAAFPWNEAPRYLIRDRYRRRPNNLIFLALILQAGRTDGQIS